MGFTVAPCDPSPCTGLTEEETHPVDLSSLSSKLLPGLTTLGFKDERRSKGEATATDSLGLHQEPGPGVPKGVLETWRRGLCFPPEDHLGCAFCFASDTLGAFVLGMCTWVHRLYDGVYICARVHVTVCVPGHKPSYMHACWVCIVYWGTCHFVY